jgi:hypothetical protein
MRIEKSHFVCFPQPTSRRFAVTELDIKIGKKTDLICTGISSPFLRIRLQMEN